MTPPSAAPSGSNDARVPAILNVFWAGEGPSEVDATAGFRLLSEACKGARGLWPEYYRDDTLVRLVFTPEAPPSDAVRAAARTCGLVESPLSTTGELRAATCDIALGISESGAGLPEALPWLIVSADGVRFSTPGRNPFVGILAGVAPPPRTERAAAPDLVAEALLAPPIGSHERACLRDYLTEDLHARALRFEYEALLWLIGERAPSSSDADDSWELAAAAASGAGRGGASFLSPMRAEFDRADGLALDYGRRWRSTLAARSFLLFAANLISGLIGALFPFLSVVTLPVQIGVTAFSYLDQFVARRRRWRAKWLDYRRVAESARIARFCAIVGAPSPVSKPPSWTDWRVARILRAAAPTQPLDEAAAPAILAYLNDVEIDRQIAYHAAAYRRFRRFDARLRRAAFGALGATMGLGVAFSLVALVGFSSLSIPLKGAVGLVVSAGPGLYAALNGLRAQFDVTRQAERSARLGVELRALRRAIVSAPASAALARAAALRAAQIMHEDVSVWDRVMEIV